MDQRSIDRKRRMAEAMMGTSAPQAQYTGRFYVAPSGWDAAANLLQFGVGRHMEKKADEGQNQLDADKRSKLAQAMMQLTGQQPGPRTGADPQQQAALTGIQSLPIEAQQEAVAKLSAQRLQGPQSQPLLKVGANESLYDPNTRQMVHQGASKPGKLMAVMGDDGRPTYMRESEAEGREPVRSSGITVNTGTPKMPAGYMPEYDDQGNFVKAVPIPGTKDATAAERAGERQEQQANIVVDEIDRALSIMGAGGGKGSLPDTGFGALLSSVPGTDAKKIDNLFRTIKANIGFDQLQAMREASPTGGALGQVSNREISFLQAVAGSLDQSQGEEDLRYNLSRLRNAMLDTIHGEGNGPERIELASLSGEPEAAPEEIQPGYTEDGYVFLGGNPGDPENWQQTR